MMAQGAAKEGALQVPLSVLCDGASAELRAAAELALALQETVSHLLITARPGRGDLVQIQNLDRLTQVLQDLAELLTALPSAIRLGDGDRAMPWQGQVETGSGTGADGLQPRGGGYWREDITDIRVDTAAATRHLRLREVAAAVTGDVLTLDHSQADESQHVDWL
ncbi:hypothetical protein ACEYYA_06195 [Paracoccus sp. p3-h83]|uniref:hypothetical protein n=1 Tax=Paracoccus sp. p3-h83 TaxID=3342805 RepID=UPI0035BA534A